MHEICPTCGRVMFPFYVEGSDTSEAAATSVKLTIGALHRRVEGFISRRKWRGATDEEITEALGLNPSTERPRRRELVLLGRVKDSGRRRRVHSKRKAVVWINAVTR